MILEKTISQKELIERFSTLNIEKNMISNESIIFIIPSLDESEKKYMIDIEAVKFAISLQKEYKCKRETINPRNSQDIRIRDQRSEDFAITLLSTLGISKIIIELIKFFNKRMNSTVDIELIEKESKNKFKAFSYKGSFKDLQNLVKKGKSELRDE